ALERDQRVGRERLRCRPVILIDQPELERDAAADRVVEDQSEDRREYQRDDDRDEQRRAIAQPLAQVLAEDDKRRAHRSVTQGLTREVQEHRLEIWLDDLDRA